MTGILPVMSTTAPDKRISEYSPVSPTTDFAAGFPVFDSDDLVVVHNGVEREDFTVSATYSEGISNDAKVTFTTGITGNVKVVGKRSPRRGKRFQNGASLPIWAQNLALDTLQAEIQELRRDIDRAPKAGYGQSVIDLPAALPNTVIGWGADGSFINRDPAQFINAAGFATAEQGSRADSAVQPDAPTFSGRIVANVPDGIGYGYHQEQTISGAALSSFNGNLINIRDRASVPDDGFLNLFTIQSLMDSGEVMGGRQVFYSLLTQTVASDPEGGWNRNYVAGAFNATTYSGDGGTPGNEKGAYFGINPVAKGEAGALHLHSLVGAEVNLSLSSGASSMFKFGVSIVPLGTDVVHASIESALWFGAQAGAAGWDTLMLVSDHGSDDPIHGNSTLFQAVWSTGGATRAISKGFDLRGFSFSQFAFASPGFAVDRLGAVYNNTLVSTPNVRMNISSFLPAAPVEGDLVWFNHKLYAYDGSGWQTAW